ncbi:MAG: hypothetical protein NTZ34_02805, partial [Chloroflexi bacterium]|nr:hypothetical protein [Chloroflexota bacterium]
MKAGFNSRTKQNNIRRRINDAVMRVMLWLKDPIIRHFPPVIKHFYWLAFSGVQVMILYGWSIFWQRYKRYWQNENNVSKWLAQLKQGTEQQTAFKIEPKQFLLPKKLKVAVVVHAYYAGVFTEVCSYLKNMPCPYTLLISVKDENDQQVINRQVGSLPLLEKTIVKIVENRGRDIKPFLVDFASELNDFDYICKVHTKKSLYTGTEKMDRRQYLYKMVLGSRQRIQAILTIFARDADVGIIYPERFEEMPYWSYTWMSNKWIAAPFVNRLGFDFDPDEYIDYPSGSMFWFKKEAMKPLLDMRLTRDDFPEERGQNDGALQHVIERCFTLSARSRGLKYIIITDIKKDIFSFTDAMKISPYFITSPAGKVRDALMLVDVVSFDIFDTLLCRPFASPVKVFQYLEELVQQHYGLKDFARLRQEAENKIRSQLGQSGDVKISQIYQSLAGTAGVIQDVADDILELELTTEIGLLIPRRDMLASFEEAKKAGKRIILTTDTYFERPHIERILAAKGIAGYHQLYISSEEGKRKDRGDMWDYIIKQERITDNNFLHVGDNEQSDLQMLSNRGYYRSIVHVMKPSVLFRQSAHGQYLWQVLNPRKGWRENLLYGIISNHFCLNTYPYDFWYGEKPLSNPYTLGYTVFGPLMHNFLVWLINSVRLDGVTLLYFLSREGYAIQKMYQDIAGAAAIQQAGLNLPSSSYLLCSRRADLFAGLRRPEDLLPFLSRDFNGTLRYLFEKRLNVSAENMQAIEHVLDSNVLNRDVSLPQDYNLIRNSLFAVFNILASQAEGEREYLLSYCRAQGMKTGSKMGLVDIGYSCTIQKALMKLMEIPLNGYYFAIENKAGKIEDIGSRARGYLGEVVNNSLSALVILKYSLLLEAVLTAPEGQLLYFKAGEDGVLPVFKAAGLSQKYF